MEQYISKAALLAEIKKLKGKVSDGSSYCNGYQHALRMLEIEMNSLEVKEVENMPNIRFPHYKSIVEKVFGAGNLESFEYKEVEQLVSLAKEELLKDLEVKEVDLTKEIAHFALNGGTGDNTPTIGEIARHFYSLGLAQKGE